MKAGILTWRPIGELPRYVTVLLYRKGDLYPVVGSSMGDPGEPRVYMLEEGGVEDGPHRTFPLITAWIPTHWAPLPETPE